MHHDGCAIKRGTLHRLENFAVGGIKDSGIRHEQLETRDPLIDQKIHLVKGLLIHVRDNHVKRVVRRAVAFRLGEPVIETASQALALALNREVDDGGGPSKGGRPSTGLERVGGERSAKGHLHMGMRVDRAGDNVLASRVKHAISPVLPRQRRLGTR